MIIVFSFQSKNITLAYQFLGDKSRLYALIGFLSSKLLQGWQEFVLDLEFTNDQKYSRKYFNAFILKFIQLQSLQNTFSLRGLKKSKSSKTAFKNNAKCVNIAKTISSISACSSCASQKLICPQCDVFRLKGNHYDHAFTYVLPLLANSMPQLVCNMHKKMQASMVAIKAYLQKCIIQLEKALKQNQKAEETFLQQNNLQKFIYSLNNLRGVSSLDDVFEDFRVLSYKECKPYLEKAVSFNHKAYQTEELDRHKSRKDAVMNSIIEEFEKLAQIDVEFLNDPSYIVLNKETITVEENKLKFRNFKEFRAYTITCDYLPQSPNLIDMNNIIYSSILFRCIPTIGLIGQCEQNLERRAAFITNSSIYNNAGIQKSFNKPILHCFNSSLALKSGSASPISDKQTFTGKDNCWTRSSIAVRKQILLALIQILYGMQKYQLISTVLKKQTYSSSNIVKIITQLNILYSCQIIKAA